MSERSLRSVEQVLKDVLGGLGMDEAGATAELFSRWRELAGDPWDRRTRPLTLRDGELTVVADGPASASVLRYRVGELVARLSSALGAGVVTSVRVRVGRPGSSVQADSE